jgi:hypothetical protein
MQELTVKVWVESDNHVDHHSLERGVLAGLRYSGFSDSECHVIVEAKPPLPDCFMCRGEAALATDGDGALYQHNKSLCLEHRAARERVIAMLREMR